MDHNDTSATFIDQSLMAIGAKIAVMLLLYYVLLLIYFSYLSFYLIIPPIDYGEQSTLEFSISLAVVGSAIFYSRKLYKACISGSYNSDSGTTLQRIGTFAFFILRPIFAAVFSLIVNLIWRSALITSVNDFRGFSETHFYISGVIGFFVGFLAGRVLTRMEQIGEKHLSGVL